MRTLALVALFAAVTLTGCLGGDGLDTHAVNSDLIDDARDQLGDDAALYGITGIEPSEPISAEQTDGCGAFPKSKNPGDGIAPVWLFTYMNPSTEKTLTIVTDGDGDVKCDMEMAAVGVGNGAQPLDSWSVSAVEAAETIAENVDDYQDKVKGAMVSMMLTSTPDGPQWIFNADQPNGGMDGWSMWAVDAESREFLGDLTDEIIGGMETEEARAVRPLPPPEGGQVTGNTLGTMFAATATPAEFALIYDEHETLELVVESNDPLAGMGQSYTVQVTGPEGDEEVFSTTNGETIAMSSAAGEYEVIAFPVAAGVAEFTVDYCAFTDEHCNEDEGGEYAQWASWLPWTS